MRVPQFASSRGSFGKHGVSFKSKRIAFSPVSEAVEHLDERGRVTVKSEFRKHLEGGYIQVLTPRGVLFHKVPRGKLRTKAPALENVDEEAMKDL